MLSWTLLLVKGSWYSNLWLRDTRARAMQNVLEMYA